MKKTNTTTEEKTVNTTTTTEEKTTTTPKTEKKTEKAAPAKKTTNKKTTAPAAEKKTNERKPRAAAKAAPLEKPTPAPAAPVAHFLPATMIDLFPYLKQNIDNTRKLSAKEFQEGSSGKTTFGAFEACVLKSWDAVFDFIVAPLNDTAARVLAYHSVAEVLRFFPKDRVCKDTPDAVKRDSGDEYVKPAENVMRRVIAACATYTTVNDKNRALLTDSTTRGKVWVQSSPAAFLKAMEDLVVDLVENTFFLTAEEIQKRKTEDRKARKEEGERKKKEVMELMNCSKREAGAYLIAEKAAAAGTLQARTAENNKQKKLADALKKAREAAAAKAAAPAAEKAAETPAPDTGKKTGKTAKKTAPAKKTGKTGEKKTGKTTPAAEKPAA